ncbi:carbamoyltransferase HypF [Zoogloea dura]|jgi:hydrogenase maturation protein HypF|uniref:Carbamoyltransferase HypF n=1 Tax=Zoogloea dura TaxID=2728840 RepID=A0A848G930_9RHOO|nr:carbamoyltransferase HypF [Zoogloea dura]NML28697.1 carbamoyltransferase HypF [Zoogloea dura]
MLLIVDPTRVARRLKVRGVVQGVGFRPFVYRFANQLGLVGWVRNDGEGVEIEIQGSEAVLDAFTQCLVTEAPPLARVDAIEPEVIPPDLTHKDFVILPSVEGGVATSIGPDIAVCPSCLSELFDADDRRWRYPFINCTYCGPRYTITRSLPYDRARTSMADFVQCPACEAEYLHPGDRRFHAEPNACPVCGPKLELYESHGVRALARDPVAETLRRLRLGEIVAIKGVGGYHLACDARNGDAVARLRARKGRPHEPLAIMVLNAASAGRWVRLSPAEETALESPERPIVLLEKRDGFDAALPGLAPGLDEAGVMLPYTPLHTLLFHEAAERPEGMAWLAEPHPLTLVMTSANPHGEPLVKGNGEAFERLAEIADVLLMHDRDIVVRCDDSVLRLRPDLPAGRVEGAVGGSVQFLRRARGFTPLSLPLGEAGPPVLALGALFKASLCVIRGREAFLSQHIGSLDNPASCQALDEAAEHLLGILAQRPEAIAHDAHPDYYSTRLAHALAERFDVATVPVQHHHAHVAAVCAEHQLDEPVLGLAVDGVGLGTDGMPWGGELLWVDGAGFRRLGHLSPLPMPGGDRAAREPWRMAVGVLHALGRSDEAIERFGARDNVEQILGMLMRGSRCPPTTSLGRWFDAAAGLLGVCESMTYEGQAPMQLESLARRFGTILPLPGGHHIDVRPDSGLSVLNLYPLLNQLIGENDAARGAAHFHANLLEALVEWLADAAHATGVRTLVLSGGCMHNCLLAVGMRQRLTGRGFRVFEAQHVPAGDGGLSLGQAWVARAQLMGGGL